MNEKDEFIDKLEEVLDKFVDSIPETKTNQDLKDRIKTLCAIFALIGTNVSALMHIGISVEVALSMSLLDVKAKLKASMDKESEEKP